MQRNKLLNFCLWFALIANIIGLIFYIVSIFSDEHLHSLENGIKAVSSLLAILSVILLRRWNKLGYFLLCVVFLITGIIYIVDGQYLLAVGIVVGGILIWRLLLNLHSNGCKSWLLLRDGIDWKHCRHLYQCFGIAIAIIMTLSIVHSRNKTKAIDDSPIVEEEITTEPVEEKSESTSRIPEENTDTEVLIVQDILNMSTSELISDLLKGKANPVELYALSNRFNGRNLVSENWAKQYWSSTLAPKYASKYLSGDTSFASPKFVYLLSCQAKEDFNKFAYDDPVRFKSLLNALISQQKH